MKKKQPKRKYTLIQLLAIVMCSFVALVAISILIFVAVTMNRITDTSVIKFEQQTTVVAETETSVATEEVEQPEYVYPEVYLLGDQLSGTNYPEEENEEKTATTEVDLLEYVTEDIESQKAVYKYEGEGYIEQEFPKTILPRIENLKENISEWCLANDGDTYVSLWKVADRRGNLLIALRNKEGNVLATFRFEDIKSEYKNWVKCDDFFEQITISDVIDYSFVSYHEVGGKNPENVQAQVAVQINRQNHPDFPNSARSVITEPFQYSCAKCVVNRWLKSDSYLEEEDLERCFRQVLLYLAGELIQEVPENVGYAAPREQGSGIWKIIDGTRYCFF